MQARKGSHSVYSIRLHLVFVTKYRRKVITKPILERMLEVFNRVCLATDCILLEFSGEEDHVHLLMDLNPKNSPSNMVNSLKSASSRILRQEFGDYLSQFYSKPVFWSGRYYAASSGGAPIEQLKEYIKNQDAPV